MQYRIAIRAIVAGFLVDVVGTELTWPAVSFLLQTLGFLPPATVGSAPTVYDTGLLLTAMSHGMLLTLLGGYVGALMAKGAEIMNAGIVGLASLAFSMAVLLLPDKGAVVPFWFTVVGLVLTVPVALAGGYLRMRTRVPETVEAIPGENGQE